MDELMRLCERLMDAEWDFRLTAVKCLNEIAEEKGSNIFELKFIVSDPYQTYKHENVTIIRAEVNDGEAILYGDKDKENQYDLLSDNFDPKDVVQLVEHIKEYGKPIKQQQQ